MGGIPFYNTNMGNRFFNSQLPALIKALGRLAQSVEGQGGGDTEDSIEELRREEQEVVSGKEADLNVRRGMLRAAELIRAYEAPSLERKIPRHRQTELLNLAANFVDTLAAEYGLRKGQ